MSQIRLTRHRHRKPPSSSRITRTQPAVEILERRQLLSANMDMWTNPSGGSWDVASNWSNGVPVSTDDVVIDVSGGTPTVTISANVETVNSITADDPLSITGGGLTVAADSTISGGLSMTGGSLEATGAGVSLIVDGATTISGASLYAEAGATLSLPNLATLANTSYPTLEATGTGSLLSLPSLTSIAVTGGSTNVEAFSGGDLEIPLVTQITGSVDLESNSATSILDVADLATFTGGTLDFSGGTLNVSGGTHQLPALTDAE